MSDLQIDEAHFQAAATQLSAAASPAAGACTSFAACGSTTVEAALGEVETVVSRALAALELVATQASTDVSAAAQAFDDADASLADGAPDGGGR